jgi:hypothetical protein
MPVRNQCAAEGLRVPANPAMEPVSNGAVLDGELVFVPGEIPRRVCSPTGVAAPDPPKSSWSFPAAPYGIRKRLISADLIPLAEALPSLLAVEDSERTRLSSQAWAAAAAGVGLSLLGTWEPSGSPDADPALVVADL